MVKELWHGQNILGEAPMWDPRLQCLFWSDIVSAQLHRYHPASSTHHSFQLEAPVCALGLHQNGGLIGTNHHQFIHIDPSSMTITPLSEPLFAEELMFNDGHVAPDGSFWAGAKHAQETQGLGPLFQLDTQGNVKQYDHGYTVANGIEFSPDGQFLYVADSPHRMIYRYPYDASHGTIGSRELLIQLSDQEGVADGIAVDREGCIWNAQFAGNCVKRYSTQGEPIQTIKLPVSFPTSCYFGGKEQKTLFITTATRDLSAQGRQNEPWSGSLLAADIDVEGQSPRYFKGWDVK
jgi:sugar lactone lactonase YvrE